MSARSSELHIAAMRTQTTPSLGMGMMPLPHWTGRWVAQRPPPQTR